MHPLVRGACLVALLAAFGAVSASAPRATATSSPPASPSADAAAMPAPTGVAPRQPLACSPRNLAVQGPDGARCVPLPAASAPLSGGARARRLAEQPPSAAVLRRQRPHELVPRMPERPASFEAYQLPVDPVFEVGTPIEEGVRAPAAEPDLGVELVTDPQTPVTLVDLEGQKGQAEVVLVGELYGITVVVRQRVQRGDRERDYLVFYGNLDRPGPSIVNGARLGPMAVIGYVAEAADGDDAYLYLEVRQRRDSADPELVDKAEHLSDLVKDSRSIAVDPRNVLPLAK